MRCLQAFAVVLLSVTAVAADEVPESDQTAENSARSMSRHASAAKCRLARLVHERLATPSRR